MNITVLCQLLQIRFMIRDVDAYHYYSTKIMCANPKSQTADKNDDYVCITR